MKADPRESEDWKHLERFHAGDREAMTIVMRKYLPMISWTLKRHPAWFKRDREEAKNRLFDAMVFALNAYRPDRGASVSTWIAQMLYWEVLRIRRQIVHTGDDHTISLDSLMIEEGDETFLDQLPAEPKPDPAIAGERERIFRETAAELLAILTPHQRRIVEDYYLHDISFPNQARRANLSTSTFTNHHRKAMRTLRAYIEAHPEIGERIGEL